ncbi:hypothetical protein [Streptomyces sp. NPDC096324]|uniref:hypothetical protein n=1 Tax=Streptomyces sp. NPDC096324 TaxID=3366085 RepID=UPI0037F204C5
MDERREQPPGAVTRPPVIVSGARLSPLQEAWSKYVDHAIACADCRHIGRGRCEESDGLYRAYQALDAARS